MAKWCACWNWPHWILARQPSPSVPAGLTPEITSGLARWGQLIQVESENVTLNISAESNLPEITRYLVLQGADVYALSPRRMSLEEIFIETVGKDGGL